MHGTDAALSLLCYVLQLAKTADELALMAQVFLVDVDNVPVYVNYFDISLIPSTVFFFNAQHIKVDWGWVQYMISHAQL